MGADAGWSAAGSQAASGLWQIVGIVGRESRCQQPVRGVESPAEDLEEVS